MNDVTFNSPHAELFEPKEVEVVIDTPSVRLLNTNTIDRDYERLLRMAQVVTKFASTLCLRHIQAHIDESRDYDIPAPAWSDSDNIWFGASKLGKLVDPKVVTAIKGLTIHEISHILMTPRTGSNLSTWVRQNNLWRAFNALEDMRIECMMTTKYPSTANWLIATIAQHLLEKPAQYSVAFPLIYGRKYLPADLRNAVTNIYSDQASVSELSSIIDQYTVLNLSDKADSDKAMPLIKRYDELVNNLAVQYRDDMVIKGWGNIQDPNGHDNRKEGELKSSGTSKPMNKADQASIIERLKVKLNAQPQAGGPNSQDISGEGMPSPDKQSDGNDGNNIGNGAGSNGDGSQELTEILDQTVTSTMRKLSDDINSTIAQFNGDADLTSGKVKSPDKRAHHLRDVSVEAATSSRNFARELEELKAQYDPAWDRKVDNGRLNIQRYANGCDVEEAFDRWDTGREDAVDIEAVILLDISPSMHWTINKAYENMWAVKRALDKINASTTVLTFAEGVHVLYSSDERAEVKLRYGGYDGSTEPLKALQYAKYVLANSDRAIKLIINITDGAWCDDDKCDNIIRALRNGGVITALAYVDDTDHWNAQYGHLYNEGSGRSYPEIINTHGCEVAVLVNDSSDLFGLAKQVVRAGIVRNLAIAK
jgi:hypothetical protein